MLKLSKLLVSFLTFFSCSVAAEDAFFEFPETTHNVSGFVQYVSFSDKGYHKDIAAGQVNADLFIGDFDVIRSQVRTDFGVTQLLYERSMLNSKHNVENAIQLGRYLRVNGFYNDIADNSISSNMTIHPIGTYLLEIHEAKMTIADGVKFKSKFFQPEFTLALEVASGTTSINSKTQGETQKYILRFDEPDLDLTAKSWGAKDIAIKFESTNWEAYGSWDTFDYKIGVGDMHTVSDAYRAGIKHKWLERATYLQFLKLDGGTSFNSPLGEIESTSVREGISLTHQRFLKNNWTLTGSYSTAKERYSDSDSVRFHEWMAGISKFFPVENIMVTASYHFYRGSMRTSLYDEGKDRNVLGVSVTKAF